MNLNQLIEHLQQIAQQNNAGNQPVFFTETIKQGENKLVILSHLNPNLINYNNDLEDTDLVLNTQFNEGTIIGYVPTID